MMARSAVIVVLTAAASFLIGTWQVMEACGPDFEASLFVNKKAPDDVRAFAQGQLGLLQAGFNSDDYAVAFRYLNGGKLSAAEQSAYVPPAPVRPVTPNAVTPEQFAQAQEAEREARTNASATGGWLRERAQYVSATALTVAAPSFPRADYAGDIVFDPDYLNCPDAAFRTAAVTLHARAASWGARSPWLVDWIHGQDAVFQNCPATGPAAMPLAVPANSPALLGADRAYQMAAAQFYAKHYDEAAQAFRAIANDTTSPWRSWGEYLAARATVRKAFTLGAKTEPYSDDLAAFDMDTMRQAQRMLEALLDQQTPSRSAVVQELNFVRLRTEPGKRLGEICAALAGPGPDANFSNDLSDLHFVLLKRIPIEEAPPLLKWIAGWRDGGDGAAPRRLWNESKGLPWLVLAMYQAEPTDAATAPLLEAAGEIKSDSPAYDTLFFQRVRLLIGSNRGQQAQHILDQALPGVTRQPPGSFSNALLGQRMAVSRTFAEFLQYAPRNGLTHSPLPSKITWSCGGNPVWMQELGHCPAANQPPGFDVDSISVLNLHTPLALLVEAAGSPNLPPNLRACLVLAAWTRSVALEDAPHAAKLVPLLPEGLRKTVGDGVGFAADLAILRNPGLRPYLESGSSRLEDFNELDVYRDNWWNQRWQGRYQSESPQLDQPEYAQFLNAAQIAEGEAESRRLMQSPAGVVLIGRRIVEYAKMHPDQAEVPAALALTVRATRFGAQDWDESGRSAANTAVSKAAFDLLHSRYPQSSWAAKTPYYY